MRYTKTETWITGLLSLCLIACGKGNLSGSDESLAPMPIGFSTDITRSRGISTRGEVVTDISNMYVFASHTGTNNWNSASSVPNFMYNQLMEKAAGSSSWTYTPLKYWPTAVNEQVSFFAYAPTSLTGIVSSAADKQGPKLTYTLPVTESGKQDLLVGSCLNKKRGDGVVAFTMKHALTQVKFKMKNSETTTDIVLTGLEILIPGTGTLSFQDASTSASSGKSFVWNSYGAQTTLTADVKLGSSTTIPLDDTAKEAAVFFLFPFGDPSSLVTLRLTYTVKKKSSSGAASEEPVTLIVPVSLPATPAWDPGIGVSYVVSVIDGRLEVEEVTSVTDFESGDTGVAGGDITAT